MASVEDSNISDPIPPDVIENDGKSVIIVDAMAEVQCLEKDDTVETCADLANEFVRKLFGKYSADKCDILYVVFDRYDVVKLVKEFNKEEASGRQRSYCIQNQQQHENKKHIAEKVAFACINQA